MRTYYAILLVLALAVVSIVFTVNERIACTKRGGILVRDAWNVPVCVARLERR